MSRDKFSNLFCNIWFFLLLTASSLEASTQPLIVSSTIKGPQYEISVIQVDPVTNCKNNDVDLDLAVNIRTQLTTSRIPCPVAIQNYQSIGGVVKLNADVTYVPINAKVIVKDSKGAVLFQEIFHPRICLTKHRYPTPTISREKFKFTLPSGINEHGLIYQVSLGG